MEVIFHNDDFGLNSAFTKGILLAHKKGVTTSTSIRTDGTDYPNAVNMAKKNETLGVGLHVNLTDGKKYKNNFLEYLFKLMIGNEKLLKFIEIDLEQQFEQAIKIDKLKIDHVNSQDHIHMIPQIFEIVCKLCKKWNVTYIRIVNEPLFLLNLKSVVNGNLFKNLILNSFAKTNKKMARRHKIKSVDMFYGTLFTDNMSTEVMKDAINDALKRKVQCIEILSHPTTVPDKRTKYTSEFLRSYTAKSNRQLELNSLLSNELADFLRRNRIVLTNYTKLTHGK